MINKDPHIIVVGGGAAGIAAAVAASRAGATVLLLERNSFAGGKATAAEVGTICGLYRYQRNSVSEYVSSGFAMEFAEALKKKSRTAALHNPFGLHYLPYVPFDFKRLCDEMLTANKVGIAFHATVCGLEKSGDRISRLDAIVSGQKLSFSPMAVIDCSGEAILSSLAGEPLLESDEYQAAAQVFSMERVNALDEAVLGMILIKGIMKGIAEGKIDAAYDRVSIVPGSLSEGCVQLKLGIAQPVLNTEDSATAVELTARRCVEELASFLIANVEAFVSSHLGNVAPEAGIRVGKRPAGRYVLTEEDVLACRKFEDAIANGSWPVEAWGQDKRVKMSYFREKDHYQIPADCLRSKGLSNLYFAGRIISATDQAIASARVIGICLQTGSAAGRLAAAVCLGLNEEEIIKEIQKEL